MPFHMDMSDHKQRRDVIESIGEQLGRTKRNRGVGVFEGPKIGHEEEVNRYTDPVLFAQEVLETFSTHSRGILRVPEDISQISGVAHLTKSWPDQLTSYRMELVRSLLSPSLGTTLIFRQPTKIAVHNLNGGLWSVEPYQVTVRDALRLLVTEVTETGLSKPRAEKALANAKLQSNESWRAAAARLVKLFRAAAVNPAKPYLVEDPYFWAAISADDLHKLMDRVLAVFLPQDKEHFRSFLLSEQRTNMDVLQYRGVDTHALRSDAMLQRGDITKQMFDRFTEVLYKEGPKYVRNPTREQSGTTNMGALATASTRLPPGQDLYSSKGGRRPTKSRAHLAAYTPGGYGPETEIDEEQEEGDNSGDNTSSDGEERHGRTVAAYDRRDYVRRPSSGDNSSTDHSNKRKRSRDEDNMAPPKYARHRRETPAPTRGRTREEFPLRGNRDNPDRRRPTSDSTRKETRGGRFRRTVTPTTWTGPPPNKDASDDDISKYIMHTKTCFAHARGQPCHFMTNTGACRYAHDSSPIEHGFYPVKDNEHTETGLALLILQENQRYEEEETSAGAFNSDEDA